MLGRIVIPSALSLNQSSPPFSKLLSPHIWTKVFVSYIEVRTQADVVRKWGTEENIWDKDGGCNRRLEIIAS
jgi:hypothetical protein